MTILPADEGRMGCKSRNIPLVLLLDCVYSAYYHTLIFLEMRQFLQKPEHCVNPSTFQF